MTSTIQAEYGASSAFTQAVGPLSAIMAAAPIDFNLLNLWGLRLLSDATSSLTRTIDVSMVPVSAATATAAIDQQGSVTGVTLTAPGSFYALPPVVTFSGQQWQDIDDDGIDGATTPAEAIAVCVLDGSALIVKPGAGYTAPVGTFVGGSLAPGGTPGSIAFTLSGGAIATAVVTPGGPYVQVPQVVITDTTGSGAEVVLGLTVADITVTFGGYAYPSAPTVIITPYFKAMVPDLSNQGAVLTGWMTGILQQAMQMPLTQTISVS